MSLNVSKTDMVTCKSSKTMVFNLKIKRLYQTDSAGNLNQIFSCCLINYQILSKYIYCTML